jgi:hypothetical protein
MGPESTPVYYARACTCITGRRNPPVRRGGDQGPRARGIGRDPKGAPGTVVRAILPQGPHALGERQRAESDQRGGMGVPPWGFLIWWGQLGRGVPRGETQPGEARRALCQPRPPVTHPVLRRSVFAGRLAPEWHGGRQAS